jgi:predicted acetyltransferase
MTVTIRDARDSRQDREWISSVYREYLGDLSSGNTGLFPSLSEAGYRDADVLAVWFRDERATPFLILRSGSPAGFALVERALPHAGEPGQVGYRLSEFFVREPHRRLGVGREAAQLIFTRFSGRWIVVEQTRNTGAVLFWRRVIARYTHGRFEERQGGGEVRHTFVTARNSS